MTIGLENTMKKSYIRNCVYAIPGAGAQYFIEKENLAKSAAIGLNEYSADVPTIPSTNYCIRTGNLWTLSLQNFLFSNEQVNVYYDMCRTHVDPYMESSSNITVENYYRIVVDPEDLILVRKIKMIKHGLREITDNRALARVIKYAIKNRKLSSHDPRKFNDIIGDNKTELRCRYALYIIEKDLEDTKENWRKFLDWKVGNPRYTSYYWQHPHAMIKYENLYRISYTELKNSDYGRKNEELVGDFYDSIY